MIVNLCHVRTVEPVSMVSTLTRVNVERNMLARIVKTVSVSILEWNFVEALRTCIYGVFPQNCTDTNIRHANLQGTY